MFLSIHRLLGAVGAAKSALSGAESSAESVVPRHSPAAFAAALIVQDSVATRMSGDVRDRILAAIEEVRPAIRMDGGDIEFLKFEGGTATIRLLGACRSCPMSEMTLRLGVERVICQLVPEVKRIDAV